ncbi:MAG: head completion/stabilization protein [Janthinobacterium lividum]
MQTLFEDASALLPPCRLRHDPFWPPVHCTQVRQALNLGQTISDQRLAVALHSALIRVERDLAGARCLWRRHGYKALEQVPCALDGELPVVVRQYLETLYEHVRMLLAEQLHIRECWHG